MVAATLANGLTLKKAAFAQAFVANGGNASQAYRDSYDCSGSNPTTIAREASALLSDHNVATRIAELQQQALVLAGITPAAIAAELTQNLSLGRAHKQIAAANRSVELMGRLAGLFHDGPSVDARSVHISITDNGVSDNRLREFTTDQLKSMLSLMQQPPAAAAAQQQDVGDGQ